MCNNKKTISSHFSIQVTVAKTLDYERIQKYYLTIVASVSFGRIRECFLLLSSHRE